MKKTPIFIAATALLISTSAFAATDDFAKVDANGDGRITLEELVVAMPDATEDKFKAADANGDGSLSKEEFDVAMK